MDYTTWLIALNSTTATEPDPHDLHVDLDPDDEALILRPHWQLNTG